MSRRLKLRKFLPFSANRSVLRRRMILFWACCLSLRLLLNQSIWCLRVLNDLFFVMIWVRICFKLPNNRLNRSSNRLSNRLSRLLSRRMNYYLRRLYSCWVILLRINKTLNWMLRLSLIGLLSLGITDRRRSRLQGDRRSLRLLRLIVKNMTLINNLRLRLSLKLNLARNSHHRFLLIDFKLSIQFLPIEPFGRVKTQHIFKNTFEFRSIELCKLHNIILNLSPIYLCTVIFIAIILSTQ